MHAQGGIARLETDIHALIEQQVDRHFEQLEGKLIRNFEVLGERAVAESARALNAQLGERIQTLEGISALQSAKLAGINATTRKVEEDVEVAVDHIEQTLSHVVPGFHLDPPAHLSVAPEQCGLVKTAASSENEDTDELPMFCPRCTSTHIRRANRANAFEQFLRLFSIAPFRCRACRYKFYRLSFAKA